MKLESIALHNFRNHAESRMECARGVNVLLGENGEGKTNVLEAVSYCCLTKSFFAAGDATVLRVGAEEFGLDARMVTDHALPVSVRATYDRRSEQKQFCINNAPMERMSSVIGMFPVVILSPDHRAITFGMPADRRKFLDLLISQASRTYFEDLVEYRRILKHRNRILTECRQRGRTPGSALDPWDESLVMRGARIISRRALFAEEFRHHITSSYRLIAGGREDPEIAYAPGIPCAPGQAAETLEAPLRDALQARRDDDLRTASTQTGPHRDELRLGVDGMDLRKFASQGQHKTFLVALKVAEFFYLKERCEEIPLLLLDDVFSELDEFRSGAMLEVVESLGQTFITTTSDRMFPAHYRWAGERRRFSVARGTITGLGSDYAG